MKPSLWKKIKHCFLPHSDTHEKAHLLSWHFLIIYILLFILLQTSFSLINIYKPGVLGVNSEINPQKIIDLVNIERQKKGFGPVKENINLNQAANLKAANMFEENYWAHFAPSGKDPWGFINASGYKFSYAGENLARNFYNSDDVVKAWMASPTHRDNILGPNYEDMGIAVVEGVLQGQKTTLVVQMFGKTYQPLASPPKIDLGKEKVSVEIEKQELTKPVLVAGSALQKPVIVSSSTVDPYQVTKTVVLVLTFFVGLLLLADFIVLKRRGVYRVSSHHFAHLSFLALGSFSVFATKVGEIL